MSTPSIASSRRHLLSTPTPSTTSLAFLLPDPSLRPSRPASVITTTTIDTIIAPRTRSPSPPSQAPTATHSPARSPRVSPSSASAYRGFSSEAAYLAALRTWVEEKEYFTPNQGLTGFYGPTTMAEYMARPGLSFRRRSGRDPAGGSRRATVPGAAERGGESEASAPGGQPDVSADRRRRGDRPVAGLERRKSSTRLLGKAWFERRGTGA